MSDNNIIAKKKIEKIVPFIPMKNKRTDKTNKILILFSDLVYNNDNYKLKVFIKLVSNDQVHTLINEKISCNKKNIIDITKNIIDDINNIINWLNEIQNQNNRTGNIVNHNSINILYTVDDDEINYAFTKIPVDIRKVIPFNTKEMKLIIKELKLFKNNLSK